ncbi:hypothetical protein HMPREF9080_00935 [Cardiobacterium valvarum F0432]|uniref:Uncharacterized protein n=1 Tax=Cardiobacterium valvarum F0432 TaxID=797473 RepID=G9ZDV1_9GAMM|nr:hypothetical protein HMPREF9080_00935 [Cardiobacterium valvarum F0432]
MATKRNKCRACQAAYLMGPPSGIIAGFRRYSYKKSRQRLLGAEARL